MGLIRRRRFRREEKAPEDDIDQDDNVNEEEGDNDEGDDDDDDDDVDDTTVPSSLSLPSTSTENQFDKAKAIGEEVIKKVPSKFRSLSLSPARPIYRRNLFDLYRMIAQVSPLTSIFFQTRSMVFLSHLDG